MKTVKPFGDINTATVLVIGHDPRLQRSQAEASVAFFLDYLDHPYSTSHSEALKYGLAKALWEYINELADRTVPLVELYVTNLCNEFLEHTPGSGTVLIPADKAHIPPVLCARLALGDYCEDAAQQGMKNRQFLKTVMEDKQDETEQATRVAERQPADHLCAHE